MNETPQSLAPLARAVLHAIALGAVGRTRAWVWQTRGFELDYMYVHAFWFYGALPTWGFIMTIVAVKKLIFMQIPDLSEFEAED